MRVGADRQQPTGTDLKARIRKRIIQVAVQTLIQIAILFLSSWRLNWWPAWAYIALSLIGMAINAVFMTRRSPETIAERGETRGMRDWDKVFGTLTALTYLVGMLLVAGLDARFGWTAPIVPALQIVGVVGFALGSATFSWAMLTNAFFSSAVRIQKERGHTVCTNGPYRFVRHPGYVGVLIQSLALPLFFGSLWAFIPAGLAVFFLTIRTALEDKTLREELPGYNEYAQAVRYRLLPGVW